MGGVFGKMAFQVVGQWALSGGWMICERWY